jgi:hypothetical protein
MPRIPDDKIPAPPPVDPDAPCRHEFYGTPWGIYCRYCGIMAAAPSEQGPATGDNWETKDDEEITHYLDGTKI